MPLDVWMLRGAAALLVWLASLTSSIAQEESSTLRVARLIRQLGSDSYPQRTAAHEELTRLGGASRVQIELAVLDADPEIRARAKDLLRKLKIAELWTASHVTLAATDVPIAQVLNDVAQQTGNRLLMGDQYGNYQERAVTLRAEHQEFWATVDTICAQSGNRVRPHYDSRQPGLVVIAGKPTRYPTAYSGPVRGLITNARRSFLEEIDYEDLDSDVTHGFQLNFQFMWEDRFRLVAYRSQPELVQARTDTQVDLNIAQAASGSWSVAGSGTRQVSMTLRLRPPPTNAQTLSSLRLKWGLLAVGDMATLEVNDLSNRKPHFQDDLELSIEALDSTPGGRCDLTLAVLRDLVVSDPTDVFFQEHEFELLDQHGRSYRKQSQTNSFADSTARMKITLSGESADSQPTKLRFVYPRLRAARDLELEFRDVPLPVARPE